MSFNHHSFLLPMEPKPYATSVQVGRDVQQAMKAEQARRQLATGKRPTMHELAAELLTKAALALH